ncbi:MAG: hypothetical protein ABEH86_13885 [Haloarcula sp.]
MLHAVPEQDLEQLLEARLVTPDSDIRIDPFQRRVRALDSLGVKPRGIRLDRL